MKNIAKAVALSTILGAAIATTPAQAWWGGGPWNGWGGGPWGGYPGGWGDDIWDWGPWDGSGWGDMTFSTSVGGRGYGRGRGYHNRGYYPYGPYGYGGGPWSYGGPWGYGGGPWDYGPRSRRYYDDDYDYAPPRRSRSRRDVAPEPKEKD